MELGEIIEMTCILSLIIIGPVLLLVLGIRGLSDVSKKKTPPARGLSKEEEARDAIAGEMWREMGE